MSAPSVQLVVLELTAIIYRKCDIRNGNERSNLRSSHVFPELSIVFDCIHQCLDAVG